MHHFFLPGQGGPAGTQIDLAPIHHQLSRVLRVQPGSQILVLDGRGGAFLTEVQKLERRAAQGVVLEARQAPGEPRVQVTLYQCMLKGDKLEWVLQKATELGIARFVPVMSSRTVVRQPASVQRKLPRWQAIAREAAEQARRGAIPAIGPVTDFAAALAAAGGRRFVAWEEADGRPGLVAALDGHADGELSLLIGPEGGLAGAEVAAAEAAGWCVVSLGPRILRAETAAIAALALAMSVAGELGAAPNAPDA